MTQLRLHLVALLAGLLLAGSGARAAPVDRDQLEWDLRALCEAPSRAIGSPGYEAAGEYLQQQIAALPNVELRRHEFPVVVPVTRQATIERPGHPAVPIYPFWPAGVRVNATPAEGITGRCVYIGDATFERINPARLKGQIAVVEASAGRRWSNAFDFGARAALILGSESTNNVDLRSHELLAPVDLPRFYVPPGEFADALRSGGASGEVTLRASVDWQRTTAVNFYALVRPRASSTSGGALMISVPYDSSGLVPDLATGASQAVQAACGLALLRDLSAHPPSRPVVLFFSGGDAMNMLATRNMLMALADIPALWRPQIAEIDHMIRAAADASEHLRRAVDDPSRLDASRDRAAIDRVARMIESDAALEQDLLFRLRREASDSAKRQAELEARQTLLNRLRYTFVQRPAQLTTELAEPARQYVSRAIELLDQRLIPRYRERQKQLRDRVELYQWLAARIGRDPDPAARANNSRLIELLIALDFSDRGVRCGPMFFGRWLEFSNVSQIQDYRDFFARQRDPPPIIDFAPFSGVRSSSSWLCASMAIGSEACPAWGVPGFSWITFDDLRLRRDTPADTLDRLDVSAILPQLEATRDLLFRAWNDPAFKGPVELKWQRTQITGQVVSPAPGRPVPDLPREGFLATLYTTANNLPRMPRPLELPFAIGVRRNEVSDTDADGVWRFEGLPRVGETTMRSVEVFQVEPGTGRITASTDIGRQLGDITLYADLRQDLQPMRSVVFACEPFSLVGLIDPRFGQALDEVVMLDARRNAEPQRYHAVLSDAMIAGFVEPGALTSLIFRFGRVGNRLLLVNVEQFDERRVAEAGRTESGGDTDDSSVSGSSLSFLRISASRRSFDLGVGHAPRALDDLGPLALATARDFYRLDEGRLEEYRRAGVGSALIDSMQREAGDAIERAQREPADGAAMMRHATASWATSARVYQATADMANDVVRGAIFLLLLCVPFAFCVERLLVATPSIYRQIAAAGAIFAGMTLLLWSFHPAFEISSSPLIIVLAFAILFMSLVVVYVLYGKFDAELKQLRAGRTPGEGFGLARTSVLLSAVLLGIANMRRRRFRTALTSLTVVLITFAVLCFTSATRYLDTATLPVGIDASHPGIMLRQRGWRAMPESIVQDLRAMVGGRTIVERWWNVNPSNYRDQIHLVASREESRVFATTAVLGLSPGESRISQIGQVIGPERLARLERGERDIIYLSKSIAQTLDVTEDDVLRVGGIDVQVAGVYDGPTFDRTVRTLSGEPLAPLRYQTSLLDAGGRSLADAQGESLTLVDRESAGGELAAAYEHLDSSQFVIVPAALARLLPNASLRSIAVGVDVGSEDEDRRWRMEDSRTIANPPPSSILNPPSSSSDQPVSVLADSLARRFSIPLFAGDSSGVQMVSAASLISVSGAAQVSIPLVLGGLIVFNTMLASIAERRREIYVFTALGLAPPHVGALFVAEACVYGLIGTVLGYVLGQGAATALLKLGWLGDVTLNYSGTSAILTMGLILLIVLLSALIPARLASQLAAPSIERTWKIPPPVDGRIDVTLPFTLNPAAADAVLAHLADFFDAHREGGVGTFAADEVEIVKTRIEDREWRMAKSASPQSSPSSILHPPSSISPLSSPRTLLATIWLTPFDLGIRQRLTLTIDQGDFPEIWEVRVVLDRLSGDDASWHRMNRPFLTALRREFLQWRSRPQQRSRAGIAEPSLAAS